MHHHDESGQTNPEPIRKPWHVFKLKQVDSFHFDIGYNGLAMVRLCTMGVVVPS
jgi:hypothetical protein